jgi:8-amino-7-oxononanoate synthase
VTASGSYEIPAYNAALARLVAEHPMVDSVIDQVDGRMIRIGDHWLADFASCIYLGFDLDPEIIAGVPAYLDAWGTDPSWSRGIASPALYPRVEAAVAELLGASDVLAFPTLTHIHNGVLPALAAQGTLLVDRRAHRTIHDAAVIAKARGATVRRFRHNDVEHAGRLLGRAAAGRPKVICMDGVNSMTGNAPDLPAFAALARDHDALLYVDDAHGFGVLGERGGYDPSPYGRRGNGIVRWSGEGYERLVLTAGFSKAYSSLLAFAAVPAGLRHYLKLMVPTYCYGGPVPVPRWPRPCSASRSTNAGATTCGPSSGTAPGPSSTTWTSSAWPPPTPRTSPWSSCPWPTRRTSTPSAGTCSTAAST